MPSSPECGVPKEAHNNIKSNFNNNRSKQHQENDS